MITLLPACEKGNLMFSITTRHLQLTAGLLVVTALAGCGANREAQLIGTWKVDPASFAPPNPSAANAIQQQVAQQMFAATSLNIKEDKNFVLNMMVPMEGHWTFAADTLTLNMTKVMGMDVTKMPTATAKPRPPMLLKLSADGKKLTLAGTPDAPAPTGASFSFVKP